MFGYGLNSPLGHRSFHGSDIPRCGAGNRSIENLNYRADQLIRQWPRHFTTQQAMDMQHQPRLSQTKPTGEEWEIVLGRKYRASRRAVSAVMPRRSLTISEIRVTGIRNAMARAFAESPRGVENPRAETHRGVWVRRACRVYGLCSSDQSP